MDMFGEARGYILRANLETNCSNSGQIMMVARTRVVTVEIELKKWQI